MILEPLNNKVSQEKEYFGELKQLRNHNKKAINFSKRILGKIEELFNEFKQKNSKKKIEESNITGRNT